MIETSITNPAVIFTIAAHEAIGQKRKYGGEPYYRHPIRVMNIIKTCVENVTQDVLDAAVLHDVIEDTQVTIGTIYDLFGRSVAKMVQEVTNEEISNATRKHKFEKKLEFLKTISPNAQTIKLADILDNLSDLEDADPEFAKIYFNEKRIIVNEALTRGNADLRKKTKNFIDNYFLKMEKEVYF